MENDALNALQVRKETLEAIRDEFGFSSGTIEIMAGYRTSELQLFLALFRLAKQKGISEGMKRGQEAFEKIVEEINA